jgi:hypothetical protein
MELWSLAIMELAESNINHICELTSNLGIGQLSNHEIGGIK